MTPKITTQPSLLSNAPAHQLALSQGNQFFRSWDKNVLDKFKDKSQQEIKDELKATSFPFAVLFENVIGDFNFATGIRNANGFNAKEIFYIGDRKFDKRGALGTYHYKDVQWIPTINEFLKLKDKYVFIGIDNIESSISVENFDWPDNSLMIFGSEGVGLTPTTQALCDQIVAIQMRGSIRSFNLGCASAMFMYDYVRKFDLKNKVRLDV